MHLASLILLAFESARQLLMGYVVGPSLFEDRREERVRLHHNLDPHIIVLRLRVKRTFLLQGLLVNLGAGGVQ